MNQTRFDRIDALLEGALAVEPAERATWLQEACAGDEALRREVEALLSQEPAAAQLPERADITALLATDNAAMVGQQFSHYLVEARIGAGGMGEVWRARDKRLPRVVALKFLPIPFSADPERVQRFKQEAQAASQLNHPNIITIHEVGEAATEGGNAHFIATEYVEGQTLRNLLIVPGTQRPCHLSVALALDIATQITSALKAAHAAWIIHRDIKPENIMVRRDGLVKVLDFGIAKLHEQSEGERMEVEAKDFASIEPSSLGLHSSLTAAGTILGTASYMSPEQARGEALDGRTDVFSLGLVLYEMVTGRQLLAGATLAEAADVLRGEQEPLPLHMKFEHLPKELERIIRKMLRRERAQRYATAGELLEDLNKLKEQLANRASRRLVKVAAAGLLVAVLFVVVAARLSIHETWEERVLRDGHTAAVRRAVFSPDGRLLVSVGEDKQVIVWDFEKRERLATFTEHTDWVGALAFAPDGKRFATGSADQTVIIWDAIKLKKETVLRGHRGNVVCLAFSPDGQVLVSAATQPGLLDGATRLWRVGNWEQFAQIPIECSDANSLLFAAGGRQMVYHGETVPVNTWDVATGQPLGNAFDPAWEGNNAALTPDGTLLVSVSGGGEVIFADFLRRRTLARYQAHQDNGRAVAISPDGRLAATGAENIILWDAVTRQKITTIDYPSIVWSATFSTDGRWLVSTHGDGGIRVWDVRERQRAIGFNEHNGPVRAVAWARDGQRCASAGEDRSIMIWNAASGRREMLLYGHATRVVGLAFAPDGQTLASIDRGGLVIIWDLAPPRPKPRFIQPKRGLDANFLALSPDGRVIATSHGAYDSATGQRLADFNTSDAWLSSSALYGLAFSADGKRMATANSSGRQGVFDTATWSLSERANFPQRHFISVSFAPDGKQLVTGEDGGTVQLWMVQPLHPTTVIGQHKARVKSVAFSPDGQTVVSAGDDKTIALWDVSRRRLIMHIGLHTAPVYAVAFSPDGKQLVSGEHDHSVRLYTRRRTLWGMNWD